MKVIKNYTLAFLLFIGLVSCFGNEKTELSNSPENAITFEKVGEKVFEIDDQSDWAIVLPQTLLVNNKKLLLSLEFKTNVILVFDYETGEMVKRIPFLKNDPNSVKGTISSFQAFSEDLLLITNSTGLLYVSNFSGDINKFIDIDPKGVPGAPRLGANRIPALLKNDKILLDNYYIANKGRLMKISVDLNSDSVESFQEIPEEHIEG